MGHCIFNTKCMFSAMVNVYISYMGGYRCLNR